MEQSPRFPCLSHQTASASAARYCPSDFYSPPEQPAQHLPFASGEPPGVDWASLLLPRPTQEGEGETRREKGRSSGRTRKVVSKPRFAFRTRSANDVLDDGYRWRKYGQKAVKNSMFPRFGFLPPILNVLGEWWAASQLYWSNIHEIISRNPIVHHKSMRTISKPWHMRYLRIERKRSTTNIDYILLCTCPFHIILMHGIWCCVVDEEAITDVHITHATWRSKSNACPRTRASSSPRTKEFTTIHARS